MESRDSIAEELYQVELDLKAFKEARDVVQRRTNEMEGPRQELFTSWAATQAIFNVLIMTITRCEGLVQDYQKLLEKTDPSGNVIQLVRGDQDDIDRE